MGFYLKEKKPTIVCLAEAKLCKAIKIDLDNNYNVWKKDRVGKGGGGVMIMASKELMVNQVVYGDGKAEVMSNKVENGNKEMLITVAYVHMWFRQDYEELIDNTLLSLSKVIKGRRVILVGDFHCKEVDWKNYVSGNGKASWRG
ncbi:hypothetical protein E2C01_027969 [Portunus trituberculatus]|uniref:Endonuclease/exonuclease/phosphatase domain-containing protein n=1 Tax=Portunus trituberculatus TaxID=210409 RepID=A0A5B7EMZ5_PORTR|nr:hypothetical protein [Portunus trituberculatus]